MTDMTPEAWKPHYGDTRDIDRFDAARDRVDDFLAVIAADRILAPVSSVNGQLMQILMDSIREHAWADASEAAHEIDNLYWLCIEAAAQLGGRVGANIVTCQGSIEEQLQRALHGANLRHVHTANAFMRSVFTANATSGIRAIWPEFDPCVLTVLRPTDPGPS